MNVLRVLLSAGALVSSAACIPAYVPPTRDDAAILSLVPENEGYVSMSTFADGKQCRTRMDLLGRDLTEKTAVRVPPDDDFTVLASLRDGAHVCHIASTFTPKARQSYTAVVAGDPVRCKLAIMRADGGRLVPEPSARKRTWTAPRSSNDETQCD